MSITCEKKNAADPNNPPCFKGVFFVGLILVGITANYFINKEAGEDREARGRRIATEMNRINPKTAQSLAAVSQSASTSTPSDGK
jgi:hypothetical protein